MLNTLMNQALREQAVRKWAGLGLPVFIAAFIWAPSRDGLEAIYALSFFIPMLLLLPLRKPSMAQYGGICTLLGLAYGGYAALSSLWSSSHDGGFFLLQWVILATWLCGINWLAWEGRLDLTALLKILIWVGAAASLINLCWFYSTHEWVARLEGINVNRNSNHIGSVFGILSLLAYIHWLQVRGRRANLLAFGAFVAIGLSLLASQSRANLFAFALLAPIACYWAKPGALKLWLQVGLVMLVGLLAVGFAEQLLALLLERGISLRDSIWAEVWQRIHSGSLLWGTGLEKEGRILIPDLGVFNHAHNAWLDTWYRTGLVGLLLSLAYLGYVYRWLFRRPDLLPLYLWLSYGCIYCFVDSRGFFWQLDPKWFCFWVPAGLIAASINRTRVKGAGAAAL